MQQRSIIVVASFMSSIALATGWQFTTGEFARKSPLQQRLALAHVAQTCQADVQRLCSINGGGGLSSVMFLPDPHQEQDRFLNGMSPQLPPPFFGPPTREELESILNSMISLQESFPLPEHASSSYVMISFQQPPPPLVGDAYAPPLVQQYSYWSSDTSSNRDDTDGALFRFLNAIMADVLASPPCNEEPPRDIFEPLDLVETSRRQRRRLQETPLDWQCLIEQPLELISNDCRVAIEGLLMDTSSTHYYSIIHLYGIAITMILFVAYMAVELWHYMYYANEKGLVMVVEEEFEKPRKENHQAKIVVYEGIPVMIV